VLAMPRRSYRDQLTAFGNASLIRRIAYVKLQASFWFVVIKKVVHDASMCRAPVQVWPLQIKVQRIQLWCLKKRCQI
jgi:hypothetical protein